MGKKTATSINSFLKWWAFVIFFSPPFSPSEAEASLMAVEEKKGGYHSPPWTHYIFGFLTLPTSTLLRGFAPRGLILQWRGAGHRWRPPMGMRHFIFAIIGN